MGSKVYDNWEKLVEAVVRKEQLRELARCDSIATSTISDGSSRFSSVTSFTFYDQLPVVQPTYAKSFFLMAGATNFSISSGEDLDTCVGRYTGDYKYNRFRDFEAVKLKSASWFDIRGKIQISILSTMTVYGAYLVYKLLKSDSVLKSNGPRWAKAMIRYDRYESDAYDEARAQVVKIGSETGFSSEISPRLRIDGWMEVQLGSFYNGNGEFEEVQMRLFAHEDNGNKNDVLKISGIEFRPIGSMW